MTATERVLAHFDRVSEAPAAIPSLRRFVLDLAVRGKLVGQDPSDEPASELLKRIAAEKAHRGRIEKTTTRPTQSRALPPFAVPSGWTWASLGDLVAVLNGRAYAKNELLEAGTPVLRVGNLFTSSHWYYSNLKLESDKYCDKGDLLFAWSASFGPFVWPGPKVIYHYHIWKLELHSSRELDRDYLYHFLLKQTQEIKDSGHGVSMIHMTKEKMERVWVPIPPLPEQRRIVAKVDELMALCDRLEAAQKKREGGRDRLVSASLARLNQTTDPSSFREQASFNLGHLSNILTRKADIQQLRQAILNLAVGGSLVPQHATDEPAADLVEGVVAEGRLRSASSAKLSNERNHSALVRSSPALPAGWIRVALRSICRSITDGDHMPPPKSSSGIPFLVIGNVRSRRIEFEGSRFVPIEYYENIDSSRRPMKGDLLYTLVGSYGIPIVVTDDRPFCVQRHIGILRPSQSVDVEFLALAMQSQVVFAQATAYATGIAQKTVPLSGLRSILVPLPPLEEQYRIVAKVNQLMSVCDRLDAQLEATRAHRAELLEATLRDVIASADSVAAPALG